MDHAKYTEGISCDVGISPKAFRIFSTVEEGEMDVLLQLARNLKRLTCGNLAIMDRAI
jgi:hypothetical protein